MIHANRMARARRMTERIRSYPGNSDRRSGWLRRLDSFGPDGDLPPVSYGIYLTNVDKNSSMEHFGMSTRGVWFVPWRLTFPIMTLALLLFCGTVGATWAKSEKASVVILTQVPCQFLESENGVDQNFKSAKKADCEAINRRTGDARLSHAKPLTLKAGNYIFRVKNKSVPYELGFWLRSKDYNWLNPLHKLTKTSVTGGGLLTEKSGDFAVTLKPGEYVYSCPLNPTPDYRLVVTE